MVRQVCRSPIETSPASPIEMSRSTIDVGLVGWRGMTVITMSRNELTRLRVLIDVADGAYLWRMPQG
jgi:hypothetical protein